MLELRVTFCIRVTSYYLLCELRVTFYIRVKSYCLLHELRVTFIARVTSYCLFYELRVTVYCTSFKLLFACELRLKFYMRVASYFLTISYSKDKDNKAVYDNKVMIKNYSMKSFCEKELGASCASFLCY